MIIYGSMLRQGKGVRHICTKEKETNHILRHEGIKIWRDQTLGKKVRNVDAETD
jgi:hypothetical protein